MFTCNQLSTQETILLLHHREDSANLLVSRTTEVSQHDFASRTRNITELAEFSLGATKRLDRRNANAFCRF